MDKLAHGDWQGQFTARLLMHKIERNAGHLAAVVAKLEDNDAHVRFWAMHALGKLKPVSLEEHSEAITMVATSDEDEEVREIAAKVLAKLKGEEYVRRCDRAPWTRESYEVE